MGAKRVVRQGYKPYRTIHCKTESSDERLFSSLKSSLRADKPPGAHVVAFEMFESLALHREPDLRVRHPEQSEPFDLC